MKCKIDFGKINYNGTGKRYPVTVEMELRETPKGPEFSASGWIGSRCGGQCLDEIARYVKTPLFREILGYWKRYHLNGMKATCEHQRRAGWEKIAGETVTAHIYTMNHEAITEKNAAERRIIEAAKRGETVTATEEEQKALSRKYEITCYDDETPAEIGKYYKLSRTEEKRLGWLRETEHPRGLLCRPCPVCGYRYGTSWNYEQIPENDLQRIREIITQENGRMETA
jgi:hypothetical protein